MKQCFVSSAISVPRSFEQALVFLGRFGGRENIALVLLCFAKYGVCQRLCLGGFDGSLTMQCEMRRMSLKFLGGK
jgi:hypothetical protein